MASPARERGWPSVATRRAFHTLLALNGVLLFQATMTDRLEVTQGRIVAAGIGGTLVATFALRLLPLPAGPIVRAQLVGLTAQVLHSMGHLWYFYTVFPSYDDVFHFAMGGAIVLVLFDFARNAPAGGVAARLGAARVAALLVGATLVLAGLWEVFEYVSDTVMGTREQDNLHDTVQDIIDGAGGSLVAGAWVWGRLRRRRHEARWWDARTRTLREA